MTALKYRFGETREGPPWKYDGDVTVLAPAGREAMLEKDSAWREGERARAALAASGLMPDAGATVPGPTGDPVSATTSLQNERSKRRLDAEDRGWLYEGGWTVVSVKDDEGGITAHRGVLADYEYVDPAVLQAAVEEELGYTYEQIRSVYRQGPMSPEKRKLRGIIDARMLALRRSGTNTVELGRAIGFAISHDGHCRTLDNAIARAKANSAWFKNLAAAAKPAEREMGLEGRPDTRGYR